jgi:hypothetical protein
MLKVIPAAELAKRRTSEYDLVEGALLKTLKLIFEVEDD